jgi:Family of unknown function (DUF5320)
MPRLNGTGPTGAGPGTGGGFGGCVPQTGYAGDGSRGRGRRRGPGWAAGGRGLQHGFRRGAGGRVAFSNPHGITGAAQPDEGEKALQGEAADLKARLDALERQLADLS